MQIISHRGYWLGPHEKNTKKAFLRSFENGFGIETDIRDAGGDLVVSHDCPSGDEMAFAELCDLYIQFGNHQDMCLAINIKSDGLQAPLKKILQYHNIKNYFVFDMSIPDTLGYLDHGITVYTRQSEIEPSPYLIDRSSGIWLDCFYSEWYSEQDIIAHIKNEKGIAVVSPELHGRAHRLLWSKLKQIADQYCEHITLCTDFPNEAKEFFNG